MVSVSRIEEALALVANVDDAMGNEPVFFTSSSSVLESPGFRLEAAMKEESDTKLAPCCVSSFKVPVEKLLLGFVTVAVKLAKVPIPTRDPTTPTPSTLSRIFFVRLKSMSGSSHSL